MLFETMIRQVYEKHPDISLKDALDFVELMEKGEPLPTTAPVPPFEHFNKPYLLGQWAYNNAPKVVELAPDKKINAIKELRTITGCGLKEAKEAVEYMCYEIMGQPKPVHWWHTSAQEKSEVL